MTMPDTQYKATSGSEVAFLFHPFISNYQDINWPFFSPFANPGQAS
jgi:hypothetical protein